MIIVILATLSATSLALADEFKTVDGKEYKGAKVTHVEPDGLVVKTKSGISKVYFVELPQEVQRRFNYDSQQARVYSAEQAAAYSAMQKDAAVNQPEGTAPQNQPDLNLQEPAAKTGAAVQGQQRPLHTPFPRYTTVLHQLPQTQPPKPTPVPNTLPPKAPNNPTSPIKPLHQAPAPPPHSKTHEKKTRK